VIASVIIATVSGYRPHWNTWLAILLDQFLQEISVICIPWTDCHVVDQLALRVQADMCLMAKEEFDLFAFAAIMTLQDMFAHGALLGMRVGQLLTSLPVPFFPGGVHIRHAVRAVYYLDAAKVDAFFQRNLNHIRLQLL